MKQNRLYTVGLILTIVIAFTLRLYRITTPLADWHSFRQADTASVAREYVKNGIDLLRPRYHDLSNIQSGLDNREGYRMVEFPIINAFVAFIFDLVPQFNIELHVLYRFISVLFSLGSLIFLYQLVKILEDRKTALFSSIVFATLPYNIFYSRSIFTEIPMVFFILAGFYFIVVYFRSKNRSISNPSFWLGIIFGSIALLLKPTAIFFALPMLYEGFRSHRIKLFADWRFYVYLLLVITPLILWRIWITRFPEGIPVFDWLLNGNHIRFTPAFFRWIFAERFSKLILGYWGVLLFGVGILSKFKSSVFYIWLLSMFLYISTFATGNVQHDYYQIMIIPIICIFVGKGMIHLIKYPHKLAKPLLVLTTIFMLAFSWYEVRGYYHINNWAIVKAGQAVDQQTPKDALIIAPYLGDTAFLYQTNRRGWPLGFAIDEKIAMGADYYVSTSYDDEARELEAKYHLIEKTADYILIKLDNQ